MANKPRIKLPKRNQPTKANVSLGTLVSKNMIADANAQVQTKGNALKTKTEQLNQLKQEQVNLKKTLIAKTFTLKKAETEWHDVFKRAARKVVEIYPDQSVSFGSFGFKLVAKKLRRRPKPGKVLEVEVVKTTAKGTASIKWKAFKPQTIWGYAIEINSGDVIKEADWHAATPTFSSKSKVTITRLQQGTKYWVRVSASVVAATGGPSSPVPFTIPSF